MLIDAELTTCARRPGGTEVRLVVPTTQDERVRDGHCELTRILLADDHALVRRGLRLILDGEPDLQVVAEAGDGNEAVDSPPVAISTWPFSTSPCRG